MYNDYCKIRNKYNNYILFEKHNNYYYVYNEDTYIINNFFHYKFNNLTNIKRIYIPSNNIGNVINCINNKSINNLIFNKDKVLFINTYSKNNYKDIYNILNVNDKLKKDIIINISKRLYNLDMFRLEEIESYINGKY